MSRSSARSRVSSAAVTPSFVVVVVTGAGQCPPQVACSTPDDRAGVVVEQQQLGPLGADLGDLRTGPEPVSVHGAFQLVPRQPGARARPGPASTPDDAGQHPVDVSRCTDSFIAAAPPMRRCG
jgi:hypothetical protein